MCRKNSSQSSPMTLEASRNARSNVCVAMPLCAKSSHSHTANWDIRSVFEQSGQPYSTGHVEIFVLSCQDFRWLPTKVRYSHMLEVQVIFFVLFVPDYDTRIRKGGNGWFWSWQCGDLAPIDSFP